MIKIKLDKFFTPQKRLLLENIDFEVPQGRITLLQGKNGVGKSLLLQCILGQLHTYEGSITLNCSQGKISFLSQLENPFISIPLTLGDICEKEYEFYSSSMFSRKWRESSGGQRKKSLLARVFSQNFDLLILDEPLNHLDKQSQVLISKQLRHFVEQGKTILMTGHIETDIDESLMNLVEVDQWSC